MSTSGTENAPLIIGAGFSDDCLPMIEDTVSRLTQHLAPDSFCISGGLATMAHLSRADVVEAPRDFNDIDIVVPSISAIKSDGISRHFRIAEIELNDPVDDIFVKLFDKENGVKIDIFGDARFPPEVEETMLNGNSLRVRTAANLGALLLCAINRRIRQNLDIVPKQLTDLSALLEIIDIDDIGRNWLSFPVRTIGANHVNFDHHKALRRFRRLMGQDPLAPDPRLT